MLFRSANQAWTANGGQILRLSSAEQAKMMADLKVLGGKLLSEKAEVKTEYDELVRTADRVK